MSRDRINRKNIRTVKIIQCGGLDQNVFDPVILRGQFKKQLVQGTLLQPVGFRIVPCAQILFDLGGRGRGGERDGFFVSPSKEKGRGCSYNKSIGPEETTVRNGEGLSGRRAVGQRRRGRSDTYGYPRLSAHRAAHRPSPKKVIQGGAKAAA